MTTMQKREELTRYLEGSRSMQRIMAGIGLAGVLTSFVLLGLRGGSWFIAALALTVLIAGCGLWITQGHIADFRQRLDELDSGSSRP